MTNVDIDTRLTFKYQNTLQKCIEKDIIFDITYADYKALHRRKTCYYTGTPFDLDQNVNPTVDRVRPDIGYTKDNCVVCTFEANSLKSDLTPEQIHGIAQLNYDAMMHLKRVPVTFSTNLEERQLNILKEISKTLKKREC